MEKYTITEAVRNEIVEPHINTRECEACNVIMTCEEVKGVLNGDDDTQFFCKECGDKVNIKVTMTMTKNASVYVDNLCEYLYQCEKCGIRMLDTERAGGSIDEEGEYDDIITCEECRKVIEAEKLFPCSECGVDLKSGERCGPEVEEDDDLAVCKECGIKQN